MSIIYDIEVKQLEFSNSKSMDFNVRKGSITLILDRDEHISMNILNILSGLKVDFKGDIKYFGEYKVNRRRIGYIPFRSDLDSDMSVNQKIKYWCRIIGISNVDRTVETVLKELGILELKNKPISALTKDEKEFVAMAGSIIFNPDLILVNHTLSNLSVANQDKLMRLLINFNKKKKKTILISSNNFGKYIDIVDDIYIIKNGEFINIDEKYFDNKILKYIEIKSKSINKLCVELEILGLMYSVVESEMCHVYSDIDVSELVEKLVIRGISIDSITRINESRIDKIRHILSNDE